MHRNLELTCLTTGSSVTAMLLLLQLLESLGVTFLLLKGRQLSDDFFIHTLLLLPLPPSLCLCKQTITINYNLVKATA